MVAKPCSHQTSRLRIIAGHWRGRKISFDPTHSIRPTPDRVRETLFNWLRPYISGAKCLDLFAGSGMLGFESISQGAQYVDMVDSDNAVCKQLAKEKSHLGSTEINIINQNAYQFIEKAPTYDIVFVDPPFALEQYKNILSSLDQAPHLLADKSLIYVESSADAPLSSPLRWNCLKQGRAGSVRYKLYNLCPK